MKQAYEASISEIKSTVGKFINHPEARGLSLMVSGPPGVGKTQLFEQLADKMGAEYRVFLTATMDPTDVVGVPHPHFEKGITEFLPPKDLMYLTEMGPTPEKPVVACFDDLPTANENVFAALFRLFQQRQVGGHQIRDNVLLCATGNRVEDRAGASELPTALANRFIHFNIKMNSEEWREWAIDENVDENIVAYVRARGGTALHNFKPDSGPVAFPTPRSVTNASGIVQAIGLEGDMKALTIALVGCCGEGWATEFMGFLKNRHKLIPATEIVKDPVKCRVPKEGEVDVMFATITSLIYYLKREMHSKDEAKVKKLVKDCCAAIKYTERVPHKEMGVVLARDILKGIIVKHESMEFRAAIMGSDEFNSMIPAFEKYLKDL